MQSNADARADFDARGQSDAPGPDGALPPQLAGSSQTPGSDPAHDGPPRTASDGGPGNIDGGSGLTVDEAAVPDPQADLERARKEAEDCFLRLDVQGISLDVSHDLLRKAREAYDQIDQGVGFSNPYANEDMKTAADTMFEAALRSRFQRPDGSTRHAPAYLETGAQDGRRILDYFQTKIDSEKHRADRSRVTAALDRSQAVRLDALRNGADLSDALTNVAEEFGSFADTVPPDELADRLAAAETAAVRASLNGAIDKEQFDVAGQLLADPTYAAHLQDGDQAAYRALIDHRANTAQEQTALIERLSAENQNFKLRVEIGHATHSVRQGVPVHEFESLLNRLWAHDPEAAEARWQAMRNAEQFRLARLDVHSRGLHEIHKSIQDFKQRLADGDKTITDQHKQEMAVLEDAFRVNIQFARENLLDYQNLDPEFSLSSETLQTIIMSGQSISEHHIAGFTGFLSRSRAFQNAHGNPDVNLLSDANARSLARELQTQLRDAGTADPSHIYRNIADRFGTLAQPIFRQLSPLLPPKISLVLKWAARANDDQQASSPFLLAASAVSTGAPHIEWLEPDQRRQVTLTVANVTETNTSANRNPFVIQSEIDVINEVLEILVLREIERQGALPDPAAMQAMAQRHFNDTVGNLYDFVETLTGTIWAPNGSEGLSSEHSTLFDDVVHLMRTHNLTDEAVRHSSIAEFEDRMPAFRGAKVFMEGASFVALPDGTGVALVSKGGHIMMSSTGNPIIFTWEEIKRVRDGGDAIQKGENVRNAQL